jgi:acetyl-CoA C-acetyltransferase
MRGIFLLLEATRQLRHEFEGTERQVPNCNIALCHGTGGALGSRHSGGTVILGRN